MASHAGDRRGQEQDPTRSGAGPTALRPRLHFTAERGWINDPHGICFVDGLYHLFYQYNAAGMGWSPGISWGHATSSDLVHWRHQPVALAPRTGEAGCWSGSTAVQDGRLVIAYTSVTADELDLGRIALAFPDAELQEWHSSDADIVITHPPDALGASVFRDPSIFRETDHWTMVVGVGVRGGSALAVHYRSVDLRTWTYGGIIASRASTGTEEGIWTGAMWECPQLFRVGDRWVMLVSVWEEGRLHYVAGSSGDYDGGVFTADRWRRITHDEIGYAMTNFVDRDDRPCVMAWLREDARHDPESAQWAGALSLPMTVEAVGDGRLRMWPHADVDALRCSTPMLREALAGELSIPGEAAGLDLELPAVGESWTMTLTAATGSTVMIISLAAGALRVQRPDGPLTSVPVSSPDVVRIIVDVGIVAIFAGEGFATVRLPPEPTVRLTVTGRTASPVTAHRLASPLAGDPADSTK